MELPIVNHPDYVAKINEDSKFPIKKFGELANHLKEKKIVKKFFIPKPSSAASDVYKRQRLYYFKRIR